MQRPRDGSSIFTRPETLKFVEILQEEFGISEQTISLVFEVCKMTDEKLGDALVRMGHLSEEQRKQCEARKWGLSFVDLDQFKMSPIPKTLIAPNIFKRYQIVPIAWDNQELTVALSDPLELNSVDDLRMVSGIDVKPVIASKDQIKQRLEEFLERVQQENPPELEIAPVDDEEMLQDAIETVTLNYSEDEEKSRADAYQLSLLAEEAPVIRLVNSILVRAIKQGANDIHFQPEPKCMHVRFRVDGMLLEGPRLPQNLIRPLVARLKVMAQIDLTESRLPQDGRISLNLKDKSYQLRLSVIPSICGSSAVLRIADQSLDGFEIAALGLGDKDTQRFLHVVKRPQGLVLITGPTGSGKTTTLYSALVHLNQGDRNIITIEDPIERQLQGLTQIQTDGSAGLTFARGLRSALRHDPDVIMVGEIRDSETASIAIQASLTGHLVFSSLHTNDAVSTIIRLTNMEIEPFLVGSSLSAAIAQRLIRTLCPKCKIPLQSTEDCFQTFGIKSMKPITIYKAGGCRQCNGMGYRGRMAIFELLLNSPSIEKLIIDRASASAISNRASEEGMQLLQSRVVQRVREGKTSLDEAMRVVQSQWAPVTSQ